MKPKLTAFLFVLTAVLVSACATIPPPTTQQIQNADCGPYPYNYQELIRQVVDPYLKDPGSAIYTFSEPVKRYTNIGSPLIGWAVCGRINAKNSFGGYVGEKPYFAIISNGRIERFAYGKIVIPNSIAMGFYSALVTDTGNFDKLCTGGN